MMAHAKKNKTAEKLNQIKANFLHYHTFYIVCMSLADALHETRNREDGELRLN